MVNPAFRISFIFSRRRKALFSRPIWLLFLTFSCTRCLRQESLLLMTPWTDHSILWHILPTFSICSPVFWRVMSFPCLSAHSQAGIVTKRFSSKFFITLVIVPSPSFRKSTCARRCRPILWVLHLASLEHWPDLLNCARGTPRGQLLPSLPSPSHVWPVCHFQCFRPVLNQTINPLNFCGTFPHTFILTRVFVRSKEKQHIMYRRPVK